MGSALSALRFLPFVLALGAAYPALGGVPVPCGAEAYARVAGPARERTLNSIDTMTIGTLNLRDYFGDSDVMKIKTAYRTGTRPVSAKNETHKAAIAQAIREGNSDLLVVQEVGSLETLKQLAASAGGGYRSFLVPGNDPGMRNIGFLVKSDIPLDLVLESHRAETWVDPATRRVARVFSRDLPALIVRPVGARSDSKPLFIFLGTHNKAGADSAAIRAVEAKRTTEIIEKYRRTYGADVPIILAGDFNGNLERAAEYDSLRNVAGMVDAFMAARRSGSRVRQPDAILVNEQLRDRVREVRTIPFRDRGGNPLAASERQDQRERLPSDHTLEVMDFDFRSLFRRWLSSSQRPVMH